MRKAQVSRIIMYCGLGLLGWWLIHRATRPSYDDVARDKAVVKVLQQTREFRARATRDSILIERLRQRASAHIRTADSLKVVRDTIRIPAIAPAVCEPYTRKLSLCEQETQQLRAAKATADTALAAAQARVQKAEALVPRLDSLLKTQPKPCRVIGIPCPKVSVGAFLGPDGRIRPGIGLTIPMH